MKRKVFLGGTCNDSTWRQSVKTLLTIDYFDPVVDDWTPECQAEEERQKNEECMFQMYNITPLMTGVFSIAEVVEAAINLGDKCVFCYQKTDYNKTGNLVEFTKSQLKSLDAVGNLVKKYNAKFTTNIFDAVNYLNNYK